MYRKLGYLPLLFQVRQNIHLYFPSICYSRRAHPSSPARPTPSPLFPVGDNVTPWSYSSPSQPIPRPPSSQKMYLKFISFYSKTHIKIQQLFIVFPPSSSPGYVRNFSFYTIILLLKPLVKSNVLVQLKHFKLPCQPVRYLLFTKKLNGLMLQLIFRVLP